MKNRSIGALALSVLLLNSGCASFFKGGYSTFKITGLQATDTLKTPEGVEVQHDGEKVTIGDNDEIHTLIVRTSEGDRAIGLHRFVGGGWMAVDLVFSIFGFVPIIVDFSTATWFEFDDVSLPRPASPALPAATSAPDSVVAPAPVAGAPSTASPPAAAAAPPVPTVDPCKAAADYERRAAGASGPAKAELEKMAAKRRAECVAP